MKMRIKGHVGDFEYGYFRPLNAQSRAKPMLNSTTPHRLKSKPFWIPVSIRI